MESNSGAKGPSAVWVLDSLQHPIFRLLLHRYIFFATNKGHRFLQLQPGNKEKLCSGHCVNSLNTQEMVLVFRQRLIDATQAQPAHESCSP